MRGAEGAVLAGGAAVVVTLTGEEQPVPEEGGAVVVTLTGEEQPVPEEGGAVDVPTKGGAVDVPVKGGELGASANVKRPASARVGSRRITRLFYSHAQGTHATAVRACQRQRKSARDSLGSFALGPRRAAGVAGATARTRCACSAPDSASRNAAAKTTNRRIGV